MALREYSALTCTLRLEGQETETGQVSLLHPFATILELATNSVRLQGDGRMAHDLVVVLDRYLNAYLQGEPQGMFSSTVAIRPLDFLSHRLTIRQGEEIKQADLSMTELYDLSEALADFAEELPQILTWKASPAPVVATFGKQPAALAALFVGVVGLAAGVVIWNQRSRPNTPETSQTATSLVSPATAPAAPLDSALDGPTAGRTADSSQNGALKPAETNATTADQLRQRLLDAWQSPPQQPGDLTYQVTVDAQGQIVSAVPQDTVSTEAQGLTPFSAAPSQPITPLPEGSQRFLVKLGEVNRVQVDVVP